MVVRHSIAPKSLPLTARLVHELRGNPAGFRTLLLSIECLQFFIQLSDVSRPIIHASFARAVILALGFYWYPKALINDRDETYCTLLHLSVRSSQGGMIPFVLKNIISPARVVSILPAQLVPLLVCLPYNARTSRLCGLVCRKFDVGPKACIQEASLKQ